MPILTAEESKLAIEKTRVAALLKHQDALAEMRGFEAVQAALEGVTTEALAALDQKKVTGVLVILEAFIAGFVEQVTNEKGTTFRRDDSTGELVFIGSEAEVAKIKALLQQMGTELQSELAKNPDIKESRRKMGTNALIVNTETGETLVTQKYEGTAKTGIGHYGGLAELLDAEKQGALQELWEKSEGSPEKTAAKFMVALADPNNMEWRKETMVALQAAFKDAPFVNGNGAVKAHVEKQLEANSPLLLDALNMLLEKEFLTKEQLYSKEWMEHLNGKDDVMLTDDGLTFLDVVTEEEQIRKHGVIREMLEESVAGSENFAENFPKALQGLADAVEGGQLALFKMGEIWDHEWLSALTTAGKMRVLGNPEGFLQVGERDKITPPATFMYYVEPAEFAAIRGRHTAGYEAGELVALTADQLLCSMYFTSAESEQGYHYVHEGYAAFKLLMDIKRGDVGAYNEACKALKAVMDQGGAAFFEHMQGKLQEQWKSNPHTKDRPCPTFSIVDLLHRREKTLDDLVQACGDGSKDFFTEFEQASIQAKAFEVFKGEIPKDVTKATLKDGGDAYAKAQRIVNAEWAKISSSIAPAFEVTNEQWRLLGADVHKDHQPSFAKFEAGAKATEFRTKADKKAEKNGGNYGDLHNDHSNAVGVRTSNSSGGGVRKPGAGWIVGG